MKNTTYTDLAALAAEVNGKSPVEAIARLAELFPGQVAFSTSFGHEDQVITDFIFRNRLPVRVFTLDTGRLFEETYQTYYETLGKYNQPIEVYYPDTEAVQQLVSQKGPYSFYDSVENRKECCFVRKIEPLRRALAGVAVWVTGLRGGQSENRQQMADLEWDAGNNLVKYRTACLTTVCTTRASKASAAPLAPAPSSRAKTSGRAAGGGKRRRKNAACTKQSQVVSRQWSVKSKYKVVSSQSLVASQEQCKLISVRHLDIGRFEQKLSESGLTEKTEFSVSWHSAFSVNPDSEISIQQT